MSFGSRLRNLRVEKNLTQAQLAEILGVSARTVSFIETGRYYPKNEEIIKRITEYFNVTADYLFGISNIKTPEETSELHKSYERLDETGRKRLKEYAELLNLKYKK